MRLALHFPYSKISESSRTATSRFIISYSTKFVNWQNFAESYKVFALAPAAMSIRISSFASVKNERMEEDDDEIAVIPNPKEIRPPSPAPPREFLRIFFFMS